MTGATVKEQYETYTVEKMYAFLSGYTLSRDPGTEFEYSNVGMALLGHVIALKAGTNFESLVVNRICRKLHMDSTCIARTPEFKARLAMGHDDSGKPSPPWKLQAYSPAGGVHSTANDLLEYVSAHAGLSPSRLTPLMKETHVVHSHNDIRAKMPRKMLRRIIASLRRSSLVIAERFSQRYSSQMQAYSARLQVAHVCVSSLKRKFCGLASAVCLNWTTRL